MKDWTEFGLRQMAPMSGRTRVTEVNPYLAGFLAECQATLAEPVRGVTSDGTVDGRVADSKPVTDAGATRAIRASAEAFLAGLDPADRATAVLPFASQDWRTWINVHMNFYRHGVMLDGLTAAQRDLALDLLRATLSARGYAQARDIMRINGLLADITGSDDEFGEWLYWVSIFGTPSGDEPWGWQIDGHHANLNCVILGDRLWLTPTFMGSEPCQVSSGRLAGTRVFAAEEQDGLDLIRSLDAGQRATATVYASIMPDAIPVHLQHFVNARMQAGAFQDNLVLPYQGIRADGFSPAQQQLLRRVIGTYLQWSPDSYAAQRLTECDRYLDETWFSWYGGIGDTDVFYYRVHSPVVLIEFDHHPGVVFDNVEPSRHHIHTVVRTPNGGDYGTDYLAEHYRRFDHSAGDHRQLAV